MVWIEPLSLQTMIYQVFAGGNKYFTAIALLVITSLAGFFRMNILLLMFMIGLFFVMFVDYVDYSIYFLIISIGGLLIGYWISKIVKN